MQPPRAAWKCHLRQVPAGFAGHLTSYQLAVSRWTPSQLMLNENKRSWDLGNTRGQIVCAAFRFVSAMLPWRWTTASSKHRLRQTSAHYVIAAAVLLAFAAPAASSPAHADCKLLLQACSSPRATATAAAPPQTAAVAFLEWHWHLCPATAQMTLQ